MPWYVRIAEAREGMDRLVFLDFDGVLCDSLPECLVSSWTAFYGLLKGQLPDRVPLALRATFYQLRPYVRSGEDYVLLQELAEAGTSVHSQQDFDAQLRRRGSNTMQKYKQLIYQARSELLRTDRSYWIGLNRIYPFLLPHLTSWARNPCLHILSTKEASYILEILAAHGVRIDSSRVLHCGAQEKPRLITATARRLKSARALWIDDQVDHLCSGTEQFRDLDVYPCLASWGYVKREWLEQELGFEVLAPAQFVGKLDCWLSAPSEG
jgi:phosphoglycolate phosphatase-like HAD superfamily hydrolase